MTDTVQSTFDQWANSDRAQKMTTGHAHIYAAYFADLLQKPNSNLAGLKFADIACGYGEVLRLAQSHGATKLVGIDLSAEMIAKARARIPVAELTCGNFEDANTFESISGVDFCICVEAIYYAKNPAAALTNIASILSPGGSSQTGRLDLFLDFYQENKPSHVWPQALGLDLKLHSTEQWKQMCQDAGLQKVSHQYTKDPSPLPTQSEFNPSPFMPSYADLKEFRQQGTLWITGYRA